MKTNDIFRTFFCLFTPTPPPPQTLIPILGGFAKKIPFSCNCLKSLAISYRAWMECLKVVIPEERVLK